MANNLTVTRPVFNIVFLAVCVNVELYYPVMIPKLLTELSVSDLAAEAWGIR